ncbi:hypothetical protein BH10ACT11_BH10ACT11_13000 [soil metagenome]
MAVEPSAEQVTAIGAAAGGPDDGPVVMLNLNRYRKQAEYADGALDSEPAKGRDAYARYAAVAVPTLARVGARILWHSEAEQTVVGDSSDVYDEVIAVWYPSRAAFLELATDREVGKVLHHRLAGLERAAIICCESGAEPVLTGIELGA